LRTGQDISEQEINEQKDFLDRIDQDTLLNYEEQEKRKLENLRLERKEGDPQAAERQRKAKRDQSTYNLLLNDYVRIFNPIDGKVPYTVDRKINSAVVATETEEDLNNVYNSYIQQWSEQAAAAAEGPIQAENATVLQNLLVSKEESERLDKEVQDRLKGKLGVDVDVVRAQIIEERIQRQTLKSIYAFADKLNEIEGSSVIGETLKDFFSKNSSKTKPSLRTLANIKAYYDSLLLFNGREKRIVTLAFLMDPANAVEAKDKLEYFTYALVLRAVAELKGLQLYAFQDDKGVLTTLNPIDIQTTIATFLLKFASDVQPLFDRITIKMGSTAAYTKMVQKIKELNEVFDTTVFS
jgi:hypothetical protein